MSQTLSHTEILQCSADDIWEACRHADEILSHQMPEYFAKSEFEKGHGEPGSIRVITMGPAIKHAGRVKERMDKFDDATKTLGYTVLEGDKSYSSFSAEMQFAQQKDGTTAGTWTAKYEPVGEAGPPEHVKAIATMVMKALERAVNSRKTLTHTETLETTPDAIWRAGRNANEILCKALPQIFVSITTVEGHGGPGSIRVCKMGPAVPFADELTERVDLFDHANKKMGYSVLKGDPHYRHLSATIQYKDGPRDGTTTAVWEATYVPEGDMGPPEHTINIVSLSWKAMAEAANDLAAQKPVGVPKGSAVPV